MVSLDKREGLIGQFDGLVMYSKPIRDKAANQFAASHLICEGNFAFVIFSGKHSVDDTESTSGSTLFAVPPKSDHPLLILET